MSPGKRRFEKGFITRKRIPVADRYVRESGRKGLFLAGAVAAIVLAAVFLGDAFLGRATTVAHGALSENHALFANDCTACHTPLEGVNDASCSACHEKYGPALPAYSFAQHYRYRSGDPDRSAPSSSEVSCASCHQEHQGRESSLQTVADATCRSCHQVGTFPSGHPEFDFVAQAIPDPANLQFSHLMHVTEVTAEYELGSDVEAACLTCHTPDADGSSFRPISFEAQCDACHLGRSSATPPLPIAAEGTPGVRTLAEIRQTGGPGSLWANFWNPNEFSEFGGQIEKRPLYHEDPWILYNLRHLRSEMFPGAELADLLTTSAEVDLRDADELPREAITTLRDQIRALQGSESPEVQDELAEMTELLYALEGRLEDPFASIDVTRYGVSIADRAAGLESSAYGAVVDSLTAECQACHLVENATIRRVQTNQAVLIRAEFDHRAHVTHARCLDCHAAIPIRQAIVENLGDLPPADDHAGIQNLPTIATCATCHNERAAPNDCTSCHLFHPDQEHYGNLSRYEAGIP